ncbi:MAG: 3-dehydroquinate synthase [Cellulosilyticaceae bacterium]
MKTIGQVEKRQYPIIIDTSYDNLMESFKKIIKPNKICIISDANVAPLYIDMVKKQLQGLASINQIIVEAGECTKQLESVQKIYNHLIDCNMDRSDLIVALGGGVVGDLAGFAASTYMRGIPFIQLPTTILAQNDSSVGGKVGVDYQTHKNMIGSFYNPILIYTNINVLKTLPDREFMSGMSEVIKHAFIKDIELYDYLLAKKVKILLRDEVTLAQMTKQSVHVKCSVVEDDLKEQGGRRILNFGHTIGHAIETLSNFKLTHGECVAYGMVMATFISYKRGYIDKEILRKIETMCASYHLLDKFPVFNLEDVMSQMMYDKKKTHGKLAFVLLTGMAKTCIVTDVEPKEVEKALEYIKKTCE